MNFTAKQSVEDVLNPSAWTLSGIYADALAGLLVDQSQAHHAYEELAAVSELMSSITGFEALMTAAVINRDRRAALVAKIFGGQVSKPVESLLGVLAANNRFALVPYIACQFGKKLHTRMNAEEMSVTTAIPLDEDQMRTLAQIVGKILGEEAIIRNRVDPRVIGGLVLRIGDMMYDVSVAGRLERLRERMRSCRINRKAVVV